MSNTRTRKSRTIKTGSTPSLRPVPDQTTTAKTRTEAEDKLWEALHAHPNNTASFLADAAHIGRSTAGKMLTKWAKDGSVTRTPGIAQGGGRAADVWAINTTDNSTGSAPAPVSDTTPEATAPTDGAANNADPAARTPIYAAVPADSPSPDTEPADSGLAESTATEPTSAPSGSVTAETGIEPGVSEVTPPVADHAVTDPEVTDRVATDGDTASRGTAENRDTVRKQPRLAPGALEGKVEDFLREHPGEELGPAAIAKDLKRSSGAISNALDRLVAKGIAAQTNASPKRYTLTTSERAATATTS